MGISFQGADQSVEGKPRRIIAGIHREIHKVTLRLSGRGATTPDQWFGRLRCSQQRAYERSGHRQQERELFHVPLVSGRLSEKRGSLGHLWTGWIAHRHSDDDKSLLKIGVS